MREGEREAKKEEDDGKTRESRRRSGPFVLSITLPASDYRSDTFRVTPATLPRPSPDYSLEDEIAPPLLLPRHLLSVHLARKDGLPSERPTVLGTKLHGGERGRRRDEVHARSRAHTCTFEVRSTRLTGVDQISEGERSFKAVDEIETKPPSRGPPSLSPRSFLFPFVFCLSTSSRPVFHRSGSDGDDDDGVGGGRANFEVDPKREPADGTT